MSDPLLEIYDRLIRAQEHFEIVEAELLAYYSSERAASWSAATLPGRAIAFTRSSANCSTISSPLRSRPPRLAACTSYFDLKNDALA
jgi:hypothetical protein